MTTKQESAPAGWTIDEDDWYTRPLKPGEDSEINRTDTCVIRGAIFTMHARTARVLDIQYEQSRPEARRPVKITLDLVVDPAVLLATVQAKGAFKQCDSLTGMELHAAIFHALDVNAIAGLQLAPIAD